MIKQKQLNITVLKEHLKNSEYIEVDAIGIIDLQTINLLCTFYDRMKPSGRDQFNKIIQSHFLPRLIEKLWAVVD